MSQATAPMPGFDVPDGELGHRFEAIRANLEARRDGEVSDADVLSELYEAYWQSVEPLEPEDDPNQTALTDVAQRGAQDAAEATPPSDTRQDDRVVDEALTCACGRPAGADGQCTACRREYAGEAIGNHGGRL